MPEQPERKRRPIDVAPLRRPQRIRYAELHLKTNFSFLEGASHPDELVYRAAEVGYAALAVTFPCSAFMKSSRLAVAGLAVAGNMPGGVDGVTPQGAIVIEYDCVMEVSPSSVTFTVNE
jgi:error-prone DNA polymerase